MTINTAVWEALGKTDPAHTKQFSRAGGFKGTALKPMWIVKRLTEYFGPCGSGWGIGQPSFQVVPAEGELMVYCTVSCWHTRESNVLWGVGGDKVTTKRSSGSFNDDEAFKKAFTDAVGNAFKFIGVGADVHLGQFEDSKYVQAVAAEFAPMPEPTNKPKRAEPLSKGPMKTRAEARTTYGEIVRELHGCEDSSTLDAYLTTMKPTLDQYEAELPDAWNGDGQDFRGMRAEIEDAKNRIANPQQEW